MFCTSSLWGCNKWLISVVSPSYWSSPSCHPDEVTLGHAGSRGVCGGLLFSGSPWSRSRSRKAWSPCACGCVWWGWSFGWTPCRTPGTCAVSHLFESTKHKTLPIVFKHTHTFQHFFLSDPVSSEEISRREPRWLWTRLKFKSLLKINTEQRFACNPDFHGFTGSNTAGRERGSFHRDPSKAG